MQSPAAGPTRSPIIPNRTTRDRLAGQARHHFPIHESTGSVDQSRTID